MKSAKQDWKQLSDNTYMVEASRNLADPWWNEC